MAILVIPEQSYKTESVEDIRRYLNARGIWFDQWEAKAKLANSASQEEILAAYSHKLQPYMAEQGYQVADVININATTPNYEALRAKFLKEHRHSEDEVRFFVDGEGKFWFHLEDGSPVFYVLCQAGDLISVPAETKHWFDAGEEPFVKAIRIFIDTAGWIPEYTGSDIAANYLQRYG